MNAKNLTKITSVSGDLQAARLQDALEKAGVPVMILRSEAGLDVLVPSGWAAEANALLNPQPRSGEIYFHPSCAVRLTWSPN